MVKKVQSLTEKVAALCHFVSRATDKCLLFFNTLRGTKRFEWDDVYERAFQGLKEHLGKPPLLSKPPDGENLCLYLAISEHAISLVLV